MILQAPSAPEFGRGGKVMKRFGFLTLLIAATLLITLGLTAATAGPAAPVAAAAATPANSPAAAPPQMPPHPRVHEAIEAMRHAREHLEHADGEFHGHRAKAIEHLDRAIHEAEICEREP
jgi:hypothetical protein